MSVSILPKHVIKTNNTFVIIGYIIVKKCFHLCNSISRYMKYVHRPSKGLNGITQAHIENISRITNPDVISCILIIIDFDCPLYRYNTSNKKMYFKTFDLFPSFSPTHTKYKEN